jgi:hypothetical protein
MSSELQNTLTKWAQQLVPASETIPFHDPMQYVGEYVGKLKERQRKAEAACGEMRAEMIRQCTRFNDLCGNGTYPIINSDLDEMEEVANKTTVGQGWYSPEEFNELSKQVGQCELCAEVSDRKDARIAELEATVKLLNEQLIAEQIGHPYEQPFSDEPMDRQIILLNRQLAEAIKESNRRDQKWMDGIQEVCGCEIRFDVPGLSLKYEPPTLEQFIGNLKQQLIEARKDSERIDYMSALCYLPDDQPEPSDIASTGIYVVVPESLAPLGSFTCNEANDRKVFREAIDAAKEGK